MHILALSIFRGGYLLFQPVLFLRTGLWGWCLDEGMLIRRHAIGKITPSAITLRRPSSSPAIHSDTILTKLISSISSRSTHQNPPYRIFAGFCFFILHLALLSLYLLRFFFFRFFFFITFFSVISPLETCSCALIFIRSWIYDWEDL